MVRIKNKPHCNKNGSCTIKKAPVQNKRALCNKNNPYAIKMTQVKKMVPVQKKRHLCQKYGICAIKIDTVLKNGPCAKKDNVKKNGT